MTDPNQGPSGAGCTGPGTTGDSPSLVPEGNVISNIERFSGFQSLYDRHRPEAPPLVIHLLTRDLGHTPRLVVDLGCGTGLSTFAWKEAAQQVIGIEPSRDMRSIAEQKLEQSGASHLSFRPGYSNQTGLPASSADIVTCSQSFHWMDPGSTLEEAARILTEGGLFAAYDCDWPPLLHWEVEQAYVQLIRNADQLLDRHVEKEAQAHKWSKEGHLQQIQASGRFRFAKEVVFHHQEPCTAERYLGLALSQGSVQAVLRLGLTDLDGDIATFQELIQRHFADSEESVLLSYRMRIGVK
ncbi:class I SAM-dependent methyltransferase [Paenibacillus sp. JSM ZJ436]|uniref:class I SAM-dependent methyltransferase n=1 Tax=Paenibacillus sp. JSM ZJ436 TaxID=3376190 RepID=UPI0037BCD84C